MADNPDIVDGTVAVTTGTKAVTGVGSLWSTYGILPGDTFGSDGYARARIDTVNSDTSITLKDNWQGPTLAAGSSYWIRYQADSSRYSALLGAVRKLLTQPILTAFAGLTAAADKIAYFTGAGTMALVDFKAWARSFLGLTPAANKGIFFTDANTAALFDLAANPRAALGDNANFTAAMVALLKLAGTPAADKLPFLTGASAAALADLTSYARTLLDDADASTALSTLGVSAFAKTLLDDANAAAAFATLGGSSGAGWFKLPGGLIVQFGSSVQAITGGGGGMQIILPTSFTSATSYSKIAMNGENGSGNIFVGEYRTGFPTASAFYVQLFTAAGVVANGTYRVNFIAIGS